MSEEDRILEKLLQSGKGKNEVNSATSFSTITHAHTAPTSTITSQPQQQPQQQQQQQQQQQPPPQQQQQPRIYTTFLLKSERQTSAGGGNESTTEGGGDESATDILHAGHLVAANPDSATVQLHGTDHHYHQSRFQQQQQQQAFQTNLNILANQMSTVVAAVPSPGPMAGPEQRPQGGGGVVVSNTISNREGEDAVPREDEDEARELMSTEVMATENQQQQHHVDAGSAETIILITQANGVPMSAEVRQIWNVSSSLLIHPSPSFIADNFNHPLTGEWFISGHAVVVNQ